MKIDQLSTFQQAHVEIPHSTKPNTEKVQLPKDVLEALEEDDLEKALFLLNQHQRVPSFFEGLFPEWAVASFIGGLFPKKRVKKAKKEIVESRVAIVSKQITALAKKMKVQLELILEKLVKNTFVPLKRVVISTYIKVSTPIVKFIITPTVVLTRKVIEAIKIPLKRIEKELEKITEKIQQKVAELREKVAVLREKIVELKEKLDEYSKPIKEWLSEKANNLIENSTFVKQALGTQVVNLMKAVDVTAQAVAYVVVPFKFAAEQMKKPMRWLKGKAERVSKFFKDAKRWSLKTWERFKRPISKKFLIFAYAAIRVSNLLMGLLRKIFNALLRFCRRLKKLVPQWR